LVTALSFEEVTFSVPEAGSASERIIDATLRCVARWGVAKTTVDDVAREASVGRATLYRLFPGGRDALFDGAVAAETARFFARLDTQLTATTSLEDTLIISIVEAGRTLRDHRPLQFLLAHEPEAILPHVAFHQMDAVLRTIAALAGPYLALWLPDTEAAARAAEWVARIVLSYAIAPSADVDVCDAASVRTLVRTFILPGLQAR
jgi:AcrR family transcriptional regulator